MKTLELLRSEILDACTDKAQYLFSFIRCVNLVSDPTITLKKVSDGGVHLSSLIARGIVSLILLLCIT